MMRLPMSLEVYDVVSEDVSVDIDDATGALMARVVVGEAVGWRPTVWNEQRPVVFECRQGLFCESECG